jgi:hypothetical protein
MAGCTPRPWARWTTNGTASPCGLQWLSASDGGSCYESRTKEEEFSWGTRLESKGEPLSYSSNIETWR